MDDLCSEDGQRAYDQKGLLCSVKVAKRSLFCDATFCFKKLANYEPPYIVTHNYLWSVSGQIVSVRDAGTAVAQGGSKEVEGSGKLWKTTENRWYLLLLRNNVDVKHNKRNHRHFFFNSILKVSMMLLWKRHLHPDTHFSKARGQCPHSPASLLTAINSHCLAALPAKISTFNSHRWQNAYYCNLKWTLEDSLPCYCYTINTNSRTIRSQLCSLPPQTKKWTWVNCKLITTWHQNGEPGPCVVVSVIAVNILSQ